MARGYFSRGPKFRSQASSGCSQSPVTPERQDQAAPETSVETTLAGTNTYVGTHVIKNKNMAPFLVFFFGDPRQDLTRSPGWPGAAV